MRRLGIEDAGEDFLPIARDRGAANAAQDGSWADSPDGARANEHHSIALSRSRAPLVALTSREFQRPLMPSTTLRHPESPTASHLLSFLLNFIPTSNVAPINPRTSATSSVSPLSTLPHARGVVDPRFANRERSCFESERPGRVTTCVLTHPAIVRTSLIGCPIC